MLLLKLLLTVSISAFIGYLTNVFAIKCLFRPYEKVKICFFTFQGLIPKRREEIGKSIANIVASELISEDDIMNNLFREEDKEKLSIYISEKIKNLVAEKIPMPFLPFKEAILNAITSNLESEYDSIFEEIKKMAQSHIKENVDIAQIIEDKINKLNLSEIETMVNAIASKELRGIEYLGLVLGAIIGLIQGVIILYFM